MPISDNNPERRNLTVSSMAFIVYYLGGGSVPDPTMTLQIVNVQFSRPDWLGVLAWLALGWFCYRYWLFDKGNFFNLLISELWTRRNRRYLRGYLANRLGEPIAPGEPSRAIKVRSFFPETLSYHGRTICVEGRIADGADIDKEGRYRSFYGHTENHTVKLVGLYGRVLSLLVIFDTFVTDNTFSGFFVPYLLFVAAVGFGLSTFFIG